MRVAQDLILSEASFVAIIDCGWWLKLVRVMRCNEFYPLIINSGLVILL